MKTRALFSKNTPNNIYLGKWDESSWNLTSWDIPYNVDFNGFRVVWFGSVGKTDDGSIILYDNDKNSFVTKQQGVIDGLTQRLSIIRRELWYNVNYGMPLLEKGMTKIDFDSWVLKTVTQHPDVQSVLSFSSSVSNHNYTCDIKIHTAYGDIELNI